MAGRYRGRGSVLATFLPPIGKPDFRKLGNHLDASAAFTISVKSKGGGGQSCWRKIGNRQSPPPSLPAYLSAIKLREQTDSIERTAYASRSRNNWELPVIPSTDPIGIGGGGGGEKRKKKELVKPWLNRVPDPRLDKITRNYEIVICLDLSVLRIFLINLRNVGRVF